MPEIGTVFMSTAHLARRILFPDDSIGSLFTAPTKICLLSKKLQWRYIGDASGMVSVTSDNYLRLRTDSTSGFEYLASLVSGTLESLEDAEPSDRHYESFRPPAGLLQLHVLGFGLFGDTGYMIGDKSMCSIASVRTLRDLDLSNNRISDEGLVMLRNLWHLEKLNLSNDDNAFSWPAQSGDNDISGDGLAALKYLRKLRELKLKSVGLTDCSMQHIACLPTLTSLDLSWNRITSDSMHWLSKLTQLRKLDLSSNKDIDGSYLNSIRSLPMLEQLELAHLHLTDADLAHFSTSTNLRCLNLSGNSITPVGLRHLHNLSNLERLYLWNNKDLQDSDVASLQMALPMCTIESGDILANLRT